MECNTKGERKKGPSGVTNARTSGRFQQNQPLEFNAAFVLMEQNGWVLARLFARGTYTTSGLEHVSPSFAGKWSGPDNMIVGAPKAQEGLVMFGPLVASQPRQRVVWATQTAPNPCN